MKERIPHESLTAQLQPHQTFQFLHHRSKEIREDLMDLYTCTSHQQKRLYGFKLLKECPQKQSQSGGMRQTHRLQAAELSMLRKLLILSCSWLQSWQLVTWNQIQSRLAKLPKQEQQPDDITINKNILKISKNQLSLDFDILTGNSSIGPNQYFLNSFDRRGLNLNLQYTKSPNKITIKNISYYFADQINLVESCEIFVAVATCKHITIVCVKKNSGRSCKFDVRDCVDMKWVAKGLYFLQEHGTVGILERNPQVMSIKQSGFFSFRRYEDNSLKFSVKYIPNIDYGSNGYQCVRLAIQHGSVIAISLNNQTPEKIELSKLSREDGNLSLLPFEFTCREIDGQIIYINTISDNQALKVVLISGFEGRPEQIHVYSFRVLP